MKVQTFSSLTMENIFFRFLVGYGLLFLGKKGVFCVPFLSKQIFTLCCWDKAPNLAVLFWLGCVMRGRDPWSCDSWEEKRTGGRLPLAFSIVDIQQGGQLDILLGSLESWILAPHMLKKSEKSKWYPLHPFLTKKPVIVSIVSVESSVNSANSLLQ